MHLIGGVVGIKNISERSTSHCSMDRYVDETSGDMDRIETPQQQLDAAKAALNTLAQARIKAALQAVAEVQHIITKPRSHEGETPFVCNGAQYCLEPIPTTPGELLPSHHLQTLHSVQTAMTLPVSQLVPDPRAYETLYEHLEWRRFVDEDRERALRSKQSAAEKALHN